MKPLSIIVTILLGIASLGIVVWIGQKSPTLVQDLTGLKPENPTKPEPKVEDLVMPKSGPFGKAEIAEQSFNFGSRLVGSSDKHTFSIKNVGEGKLSIKLGKPTCQCTIGEITKVDGAVTKEGPFAADEEVLIAPNETVNILVQWVMKVQNENFRQQVPVFTTDPDQREIKLEIVGVIDGAVHLTPGGVWELGELSRTEPTKAAGFAYSSVFADFKLTEKPRTNSHVKVSLEPADADVLESKGAKSGYTVTVEVDQSAPIGYFRETVAFGIEVDRPADLQMMRDGHDKPSPQKEQAEKDGDKTAQHEELHYDLEFTITAHRSGPIEIRGQNFSITTNRMVFGEFKAAEGKKAKLMMYPKGMTEDLALVGVEPADSRIKATLQPGKVLGNTKSYQLDVEITPGPADRHNGDKAEVINLKLNHPEAPDLKLLIDYTAKD